jgi:hypothetical protein
MRGSAFSAFNRKLVEGLEGWRFAPVVRAGTPSAPAATHVPLSEPAPAKK